MKGSVTVNGTELGKRDAAGIWEASVVRIQAKEESGYTILKYALIIKNMNIEIIAGSPRENSVTYRVALFLKTFLEQHTQHSVNIIDVREWNLPLLQHVFVSEEATPDAFKPLSRRMFAAHAFILVTPEYNGSYTPAMKNLLDHYPKQSHKAFGIVTASPGPMGGMRATQQMQLLINALFGIASPYMLVVGNVDKRFDAEGNLLDDSYQKAIDVFVKEFLWLAESLHPETVLN